MIDTYNSINEPHAHPRGLMNGLDEKFLQSGLAFNSGDDQESRNADSPQAFDRSTTKRADIANALKMDRVFPININYANGIERASQMEKTKTSILSTKNVSDAPFQKSFKKKELKINKKLTLNQNS